MAVESEYRNALKEDSVRLHFLMQTFSKPNHPYGRFGWGNRSTLWDLCQVPKTQKRDPIEQLLKFYNSFYSANLMSLAVLGKESLDKLASIVIPLFAEVENKSLNRQVWNDHPYSENQMAKKIMTVPLKDIRSMQLVFATPDLNHLYKR